MTLTSPSARPSPGRVAAAAAAATLFALLGGLWIDTALAHSPGLANRAPVNKCVPADLRGNAISFRSSDGVRLSGLVLGDGTKGVMLAHESGWDICSWLPFARILAGSGYRVILWDFRNVGASGKSSEQGFYHLERDVLAAAKELTNRGVTSIVAGGASAGGTATLKAASTIPGLKGVVIMSSPRSFGVPASDAMDGIGGIRQIPQPVFLAAATENQGFAAEVRGLYEASPSKDKHLELVPGETHGADLLDGAVGAPLHAKTLAFVKRVLGDDGATTPPATGGTATGGTATGSTAAGGATAGAPAAGAPAKALSATSDRDWPRWATGLLAGGFLLIAAITALRRRAQRQ